MTIQATITTLTLSVSIISGSWTLASAESTAGDLTDAVPVQFEKAVPLFAEPTLPIGTIVRRIAADPLWGHRSIIKEGSSPIEAPSPEEASFPTTWQWLGTRPAILSSR